MHAWPNRTLMTHAKRQSTTTIYAKPSPTFINLQIIPRENRPTRRNYKSIAIITNTTSDTLPNDTLHLPKLRKQSTRITHVQLTIYKDRKKKKTIQESALLALLGICLHAKMRYQLCWHLIFAIPKIQSRNSASRARRGSCPTPKWGEASKS